jgi:hypothetical protein
MTQEIIDMAKDANLLRTGDGFTEPHRWGISEIKAFANLVAAHEREACAQAAAVALLGADRELAERVVRAIHAREQA